MKHLQFPFEQQVVLQIKNGDINKKIACELASSTIEIFQSLSFRTRDDFNLPLVLEFNNPTLQSLVLANNPFPVEHICVDENGIADKIYLQLPIASKGEFIQCYSGCSFMVLAPKGFIKNNSIKEKVTQLKIKEKKNR